MAYPDIKSAGALAEFVRWGNRHHGLLDGTMLADDGAGVSHPALGSFPLCFGLWLTPAFSIRVPGLPAAVPGLPAAVPGMEWHDYATFSGTQLAFYRTNIVPSPQALSWVASFGVGDTWLVSFTSGDSVIPAAGGGTLTVGLVLTRFGQMQMPEDEILSISLTSNTVSAGQPLFTGGADDFPSSNLTLQLLDISASGNAVLLAAMPTGTYPNGTPRGLYLLEFTRGTATLTLLKARSDMLVSCITEWSEGTTGGSGNADASCSAPGVLTVPPYHYTTVSTTTAINLLGGYFDAADAVEYIRSSIVSVQTYITDYEAYTLTCELCTSGSLASCTLDAQTISSTTTRTVVETATLEKVVGTGVIASATSTYQVISAGSHMAMGGSFENTQVVTESSAQSSILGRPYAATNSLATPSPTVTPGPENPISALWPFELSVRAYPDFTQPGVLGSFIRAPFGFDVDNRFPISCVGLGGLLAHRSHNSNEASFFHARTGGGGYVSLASSAIVSIHPQSGELGKKVGTWTFPPSFGWV